MILGAAGAGAQQGNGCSGGAVGRAPQPVSLWTNSNGPGHTGPPAPLTAGRRLTDAQPGPHTWPPLTQRKRPLHGDGCQGCSPHPQPSPDLESWDVWQTSPTTPSFTCKVMAPPLGDNLRQEVRLRTHIPWAPPMVRSPTYSPHHPFPFPLPWTSSLSKALCPHSPLLPLPVTW